MPVMKIARLPLLVFIACLVLSGCKTPERLIDDKTAELIKNGSSTDIVDARRIAENYYRPAYSPADQQRDQKKNKKQLPLT